MRRCSAWCLLGVLATACVEEPEASTTDGSIDAAPSDGARDDTTDADGMISDVIDGAPLVCDETRKIVNRSKCCGPPLDDVDVGCDVIGDGLTYCRCTSNADCTDPGRPRCGHIDYCFDYSDSVSRVPVCVP